MPGNFTAPSLAAAALCLSCFSRAADLQFPSAPPLEPAAAAKSFHVLDGFEMQLIASEPLVTDPVAITYDEDGRAYVCEMNDYPYTDKQRHKHNQENPSDQAIGKVRLLTDTDGDGVFDKAAVFADGLSWPTGAACWKGGIFVTATPDIWYLKDTDGDGAADVRQKIFTGFKKLNVQAVMNNPVWGLDHRIYVAGGSNGGEIQRAPGSESVMPLPQGFKPVAFRRNDFSFDPSTGDVRLESGGARFGQTFDDWGNRFLCNIRNPCQHVVIPHRYLVRNPHVAIPSPLNDCAEAGDQLPVYRTSPPEPWREFRAKRWSSEGSTLPRSELVGAGVVTSSSGITVYRGDAYPKECRDFAFVADVAGNLFYRMKLVPDGVTFKALQVDGKKNFCTSDDTWFRPVNFVNAPDGCLHVCDMYREIIEHPWSIPDDIHASLDLLRGRDRGRIWRLAPKGGATVPVARKDGQAGSLPRPAPQLSKATTSELADLLDHPNAWHRETAQRLLFERQDKSVEKALRQKFKWIEPLGRLHALHSLRGLGLLTTEDLVYACRSESWPRIQAQAFLTGESEWAGKKLSPELIREYQIAGRHHDPQVRMAATLVAGPSLGGLSYQWHPLPEDIRDHWISKAILLGSPLLSQESIGLGYRLQDSAEAAEFAFEAAKQSVPKAWDGAPHVIRTLLLDAMDHLDSHPLTSQSVLMSLHHAVGKHGSSLQQQLADKSLDSMERMIELCGWVERLGGEAAEIALSRERENTARIRAIHRLGLAAISHSSVAFARLLSSAEPAEIQLAALEALGSYREPEVADILLDAWPRLTPPLRDKAITILLSRTERIAKLLDAIEAKKITPAQLNVAAKATLGRQKSPALSERIAKLIGDGSSSNRKEVIDKYLMAMGVRSGHGFQPAQTPDGKAGGLKTGTTPPDAARGAKIYEAACMVCHKHGDRGNDVGPHLGTVKAWPVEQILTNILDPNREVSPNFSLYIIETNDGRTISGVITGETAGNLALKLADGSQQQLLRSEIKSLASPGISLMPDGLEAAITPGQMADLIEFLRK